ncbi:HypC/HybG/HupF family hydrogenase formation chaperone [Candidatus Woesearchaeota archaeon]|nr:HypC/HybG/HupF family hydrogenase formation chaperone [Candidatus Woesearchaeota archaeon]
MCFAIPGKVVEIDNDKQEAIVDYDIEKRAVGIPLLPELKVGDFVLVQAKIAVQIVPEDQVKQFMDSLDALEEEK